jgi:C4-dicarboxylate transporter, DctM subunit
VTFLIILACLVLLILTGIPVFAALGLFGGTLMAIDEGGIAALGEIVFGKLNIYLLVAIPLFTLMAHFMIRGKIVDDLYGTANTLLRALPGGLGVATVVACTIFAAISGSSVATALTIGAVAVPQMIRYGYSDKAAYGVVGGGGTLGILIPPSGPMVLYAVVADASIGQLFMAGVIPGLMMAGMFSIYCMVSQGLAGAAAIKRPPRASVWEMLVAIKRSFWALTLPVFVLGGMYMGVFTATEAAAAGAFAALVIATVVYRTLSLMDIWRSAMDASRTSAMIFMILAAAAVFSHLLTKMRIPQEIVALVTTYGLGQLEFLLAVMLLIFILGMFLETISIILITTPIVLPVLIALDINPIWYGVLLMINLELALITPPVGMNLFTIKAITKAPIGKIIAGVVPYALMLLVGLGLLLAFPQIALWLPSTMMGR